MDVSLVEIENIPGFYKKNKINNLVIHKKVYLFWFISVFAD